MSCLAGSSLRASLAALVAVLWRRVAVARVEEADAQRILQPAQRKLLTVFMPLFFGAMMLFLPSGLVLYILVNTVLGLFQQRWSQNQTEAAA